MTTKITTHVQDALNRLTHQFKGQPKIESLLTALSAPFQDLENALWQLLTERQVETAYGTQLDAIGKLVGQSRLGLSDDDYRRYIRARIKTNRSSGTAEQLIEITLLIINDVLLTAELEVQGVASVVIRIQGVAVSDQISDILISFLRSAVAGGVRVILESSAQAPGTWMKFDTPGRGWDVSKFLDARE